MGTNSAYKKKVVISNESASAESRAQRLRKLRNIANLSREEMCNHPNLNINTYKGWEIARYGGLPIDGAERVIKRVADEGVICDINWLLYGKDPAPYIIPLLDKKNSIQNVSEDIASIHKEIMLFQSLYQHAIYTTIEDDGLSPFFKEREFVAGIKKNDQEIEQLVNTICIVQTNDEKILVRYLKVGKLPNTYMLLCTNPNSRVEEPTLYDIKLKFAASIIRHYIPIK